MSKSSSKATKNSTRSGKSDNTKKTPASGSGISAAKKADKNKKESVSVKYEKVVDPKAGGSGFLSEVHVSLGLWPDYMRCSHSAIVIQQDHDHQWQEES